MIKPGHRELLPLTGPGTCGATDMPSLAPERRAPEQQSSDQAGKLFLESHPSCALCLRFSSRDSLPLGAPLKGSGVLAGRL